MKKRTLSLLLALLMVIGLLPVTARAGELDNGLLYEVYEDHVEITGYTGAATEVMIPAEIEGLPVTVIGKWAFGNSHLSSITIPASVQVVELCAFQDCYNLSEIHFLGNAPAPGYDPNDMTGESSPFYGVTATAYYPDGDPTWADVELWKFGGDLTWIGQGELGELDSGLQYEVYEDHVEITGYEGDATDVVIPSTIEGRPVTTIVEFAFGNCANLTSISIPESVTFIDNFAFYECNSLTTIYFTGDAPEIGARAFECEQAAGVTAIAYYPADNSTWTDEVKQNYGGTISWVALGSEPSNSDLIYEIYEDHVEITGYNILTQEIVIPAEIVGLPVTSIGDYAFSDCVGLTGISIPDSVTHIGYAAFYGCYNLTSISIPDGVTFIDDYTFYNCSSLVSISIPDNITSIGESAFQYCSSLTSVSIPDGITSIGIRAFVGCSSLTSISIPQSTTFIGDYAFNICSSLTGIYVDDNNPNYSCDGSGVLFDREKTRLISAPGAIANTYTVPDSVTTFGNYAFESCHNLTSIFIPDSIVSINRGAFYDCSSLSNIDIPDGVTFIGDYAFSNCSSLTSIDIPNGITSIGHGIFSWCISLSDVSIPNSVTSIGESAFYACSSLSTISIPDGVTSIGANAFGHCYNLTTISIPDSVTSIGSLAFCWCTNLTSIYFNGDAPELAEDVFEGEYVDEIPLTAYYPSSNSTWTDDKMQNYGRTITWTPYTPNPFTDVPTDSFYAEPVLWALENGITSGITPTEFGPYDSCLRAQVVTFLWRAAGEPKAESKVNPFVDVKPTNYYYDAVLWAVEKGIAYGADETHFEPNGVCNRSQVVSFLYRAFENPPVEGADNPFKDVPNGAWYAAPVLWAVKEGIAYGLSESEFGPNDTCNRSQVVTFLYRAYN